MVCIYTHAYLNAIQTVEYMAWQLLTKYATDSSVKALVDKFDFYIVPITNPDGMFPPDVSLNNGLLAKASSTPRPLIASGARTARP